MKITRFHGKWLFSIGEIDLDLKDRGLLLVTGHSIDEGGANGSGKSSLSNKGLLWTLFGSTASGDKADAVINRFRPEGEETFGAVEFESASGGRFRIHRSRSPNRLLFYDLVSNQNISTTSEKDTQALINHTLGRSRETFIQTEVFGQGKEASFLDLTPKGQMELLENILPFERLTELCNKTKIYLTQVKFGADKYQRKAAETQGQLHETQRQDRVLSDSVDKWEADNLQTMVSLTEQIANLQVTGEIAEKIRDFESRISQHESPLIVKPKLVAHERSLAELEPYIKTYEDIIQNANKDLMRLKTAPKPAQGACPTCTQPWTEEHLAKAQVAYDEYIANRIEIERSSNVAAEYLKDVKHQYGTHQLNAALCRAHIDMFEAMKQELTSLQVQTNVLKITQLELALEDAKAAKNPYSVLYEENLKRMNMIVGHYNTFKSKVDEMAKEGAALEFWIQSFNKDLKTELLKQVCPFLTQKATTHLAALGNAQIKVKFNTTKVLKNADERSEFTVSVESATGGGTYDSLSGGEKQMVNFAVGMALAELAESQVDGPSKLAILDEPFVALDSRNSESVVEYLRAYLTTKKSTILLVSNEESLKMLIPNQISVTKENGISRLDT
jgi:DNA repair exonuclease SbcCD ATPase subunit